MQTGDSNGEAPAEYLARELAIANQLSAMASNALRGKHTSEGRVTRKHVVFSALADKSHLTFKAIQNLCEDSLIDDAFALLRVLIEAVINAAYVAHLGDEVARDYAEYVDFKEWIEFEQLRRVAPEITDGIEEEAVQEMRRRYESVRDRYEKNRNKDWCSDNLFERAAKVDAWMGTNFNLMRKLVNVPWRKASAHVHSTVAGILSRIHKQEDSGVLVQRRFSPEEGALVLSHANLAMFALTGFIGTYLGTGNLEKWQDLWHSWEEGVLQYFGHC